jgi:hypothetical protein
MMILPKVQFHHGSSKAAPHKDKVVLSKLMAEEVSPPAPGKDVNVVVFLPWRYISVES